MEHQTAVSEVTRTRATVTTISIYFIAVAYMFDISEYANISKNFQGRRTFPEP